MCMYVCLHRVCVYVCVGCPCRPEGVGSLELEFQCEPPGVGTAVISKQWALLTGKPSLQSPPPTSPTVSELLSVFLKSTCLGFIDHKNPNLGCGPGVAKVTL